MIIPNYLAITVWSFFALESFAAAHNPAQFLDSIRGSNNEGEQVVQQFCASCHAVKPLIELGAPKLKQKNDWNIRVNKGLTQLFQHVEEGYGAMPARGGCFECSDLQLRLAILALLPKFMQKNLLINNKVQK